VFHAQQLLFSENLCAIVQRQAPNGNIYFVELASENPGISRPTENNLWFPQKIFPRTTQSALKANNRGQENIHFASFYLLNGPGMQQHHLGKALLCNSLLHSFAAHIVAEQFEMRNLDTFP
jgi:hypothetical protein